MPSLQDKACQFPDPSTATPTTARSSTPIAACLLLACGLLLFGSFLAVLMLPPSLYMQPASVSCIMRGHEGPCAAVLEAAIAAATREPPSWLLPVFRVRWHLPPVLSAVHEPGTAAHVVGQPSKGQQQQQQQQQMDMSDTPGGTRPQGCVPTAAQSTEHLSEVPAAHSTSKASAGTHQALSDTAADAGPASKQPRCASPAAALSRSDAPLQCVRPAAVEGAHPAANLRSTAAAAAAAHPTQEACMQAASVAGRANSCYTSPEQIEQQPLHASTAPAGHNTGEVVESSHGRTDSQGPAAQAETTAAHAESTVAASRLPAEGCSQPADQHSRLISEAPAAKAPARHTAKPGGTEPWKPAQGLTQPAGGAALETVAAPDTASTCTLPAATDSCPSAAGHHSRDGAVAPCPPLMCCHQPNSSSAVTVVPDSLKRRLQDSSAAGSCEARLPPQFDRQCQAAATHPVDSMRSQGMGTNGRLSDSRTVIPAGSNSQQPQPQGSLLGLQHSKPLELGQDSSLPWEEQPVQVGSRSAQ